MTDNGSGIFQSRHQALQGMSENDPLDFSSINNHTQGTLSGLILDHLVLLLQCTNEDNQIQKIKYTLQWVESLNYI